MTEIIFKTMIVQCLYIDNIADAAVMYLGTQNVNIHLSQFKVQLVEIGREVSRVTEVKEVWHQVPIRNVTAFLGSFWVLH